jgi:hypothetical protein
MYCTDRTHLVCGHQFSNCYPLTCTHLALRQCPDEAAPTDLTRLRETGSTLDIWLVPYKWLGGVCLSNISDAKTFATEGPDRGVIETIAELVLWLYVRRHRNGSISKALSAT